jgi:ACS family sodium-dependent inorganic phosphate cotransporter
MSSPVAAAPARAPYRWTVLALCAAATFLCYIDRVNISVAIIPMAEEFGWDIAQRSRVLAAFFAGYLCTQVFGGWLADRVGGKRVLLGGVVLWSLFTALAPPAAAGGFAALIAARVAMGLGEGVSFPSIYALYSRWIPVAERSRAVGLNFSAIPLGTVFALVLTPWIIRHFGWPWVFYSFGALGLVWAVVWQRLVTATPEENPRVGPEELRAIRAGSEALAATQRPPFSAFLASPAVWAIIIGHFCNNWGGYVMLTLLPTYLNTQLGVDLDSVGWLTMAPSIVSFLCLNSAGAIGDRLIRRGMRVVTVRKLMQTISFGSVAAATLAVAYIDSAPLAVAVMCVSSALGAASGAGFGTNHLDIAPRHAGVLMGLSNTAGTLPGIIGVLISGWIVQTTGSWVAVFQLAAAVKIFGLLYFLAFAKGEKEFD